MNQPPHDLRASVRRELALPAPSRRPRRSRLLRVSAVAALLWSFAGGPAPAQPPYQQEVLPELASLFIETSTDAKSSPDLADLDGDGDLDVVVGERQGGLVYFENIGTSNAPTFARQLGSANPFEGFNVFSHSNPELVDLDGDGDFDVFVGGETIDLYLENVGSTSEPVFVERTGTANPFDGVSVLNGNHPELVDLDGDGDFDAVLGDTFGDMAYFENTGSSTAPSFVERTGSANPFEDLDLGLLYKTGPVFADVDGDGDLDATPGNGYGLGSVRFLENTGSSVAPAFIERTGTANPFDDIRAENCAPDVVDLDGDGDFDVLIGEREGNLFYWENTGSSSAPAFEERQGTANPFGDYEIGFDGFPELADLDGDGDLDAIIGGGDLSYFENVGSTSQPILVERTGSANPFEGVPIFGLSVPTLADLDGDSDLDALLGIPPSELFYLENTGSSTAPAFVERTGTSNPFPNPGIEDGSIPDLIDLDGDGDFDAVLGGGNGGLTYLENTGSSSVPVFVERTGSADPFQGVDVGIPGAPEFADVDLDGDFDAVLSDNAGDLTYLENVGSSTAGVFVQRTGSANPLASVCGPDRCVPEMADLDGDGDLDVLAGASRARFSFYRSLSPRIFKDGFETGDTTAWSATVP